MEVLSASIDSVQSQRTAKPAPLPRRPPVARPRRRRSRRRRRRPPRPSRPPVPPRRRRRPSRRHAARRPEASGDRGPVPDALGAAAQTGAKRSPYSATRASTSSAVNRSAAGSPRSAQLVHLLPGDRRGHRRLGQSAQRVGGHRGLGRMVLAPVDEDLAPAETLFHVGHHQLGMGLLQGPGHVVGVVPHPSQLARFPRGT